MWKEIRQCYEMRSWRLALVDLALVCFIVATVSFTRFLFVIPDELQALRTDFDSHAASLTTAVQGEGTQISSGLTDLNVTGKVITYRLDTQATSVRALLTNATKQSQVSSQQEMKTTRDAITTSLADTKQAIQSVADKTAADDTAQKPVQVNVQAPKDATPPTVTVQLPPSPAVDKHKKRSPWGRFWHFMFRLKD